MILTRAGANTPSDAYDSYREYRVEKYIANTFLSEVINFIRQCSKLFHTHTILRELYQFN